MGGEECRSSWEEEREPAGSGRSRSASQDDPQVSSTAEMLRELIQQKKSLLLGRLDSLNSEAESDACSSIGASEVINQSINHLFQDYFIAYYCQITVGKLTK